MGLLAPSVLEDKRLAQVIREQFVLEWTLICPHWIENVQWEKYKPTEQIEQK